MLLYTIADTTKMFEKNEQAACVCRRIPGGFVEGTADNDGFTVSRLISTDPASYLNPHYAPGSRMKHGGAPNG